MFCFLHNRTSGYVALMASVIISAILLVLTITAGSIGWSTRMSVLGFEAKAASKALAYGCANYVIGEVIADSHYIGNATSTYPNGSCYAYLVDFNAISSGLVSVRVLAIVRDSYTRLEVVYDIADTHTRGIPIARKGGVVSTDVQILYVREF